MRMSDGSSDVRSSDLSGFADLVVDVCGAAARITDEPERWDEFQPDAVLVGPHADDLVGWQFNARREHLVWERPRLRLKLGCAQRSEERRVGKEWVSTCRSRWSQSH